MRIENAEIQENTKIKVVEKYDKSDWNELMKYEYWNSSCNEGI
jgi:hypothetical protein